ncbi:MAG: hypothetical protein ABIQ61_01665 [Ornithinibacter sp.]
MDESVPSPPGIHPTHEDQTWRTELKRPRRRPPGVMSDLDVKNAHDIVLQQIIDDLTREHQGHEHDRVTLELAQKIAEHQLAPKPRPWLDAVADSVISGNAYVLTQRTAEICDVPPPSSRHPGRSIL